MRPSLASPVSDAAAVYGRRLGAAVRLLGLDGAWGWQEHTLAMLSDRVDDAPRYPTAAVLLARQQGKTVLMALLGIDRTSRGQTVAYTSHQRQKARQKWDELAVILAAVSPGRYRVVRRTGGERIIDRVTGGALLLVSPDDAGGRSDTLDTVLVDEAAHIDERFLRSVRASMLTRPEAQIVMISSGMTDASVDLAAARDAAVERLPTERPAGFGLLEWSASTGVGHDGLDLDDETLWASCIPTLGLPGGARLDAVREARASMPPEDFAREFLTVATGSPSAPPIRASWWEACAVDQLPPVDELRHRVVAADTSPDQDHTAVVIAGLDTDGRPHAALLASAAGDEWLWDELRRVCREAKVGTVIVDQLSPASRIGERAKNLGALDVTVTGARYLAGACATTLSMVRAGQARVVRDDELTAAALSALRRPVGDAGWAWGRRPLGGPPICGLVAASLALHSVSAQMIEDQHRPPDFGGLVDLLTAARDNDDDTPQT